MVNGMKREQTPELLELKQTRLVTQLVVRNEREKLKITSGIPVWMMDNGRETRIEFSTDCSSQFFFHSNIHEGLYSFNMEVTLKQ